MYRTDASKLNLHTARCLEQSGRKPEAIRVLQAVLRDEPGSGFAEEARARLDGHEWTSPELKRVSETPSYPRREAREGSEGLAYIRVAIDAEGKLVAYQVIEATSEGFASAATFTVLHGSFEPARMDDKAVPAHLDITFAFRLRSFHIQ